MKNNNKEKNKVNPYIPNFEKFNNSITNAYHPSFGNITVIVNILGLPVMYEHEKKGDYSEYIFTIDGREWSYSPHPVLFESEDQHKCYWLFTYGINKKGEVIS